MSVNSIQTGYQSAAIQKYNATDKTTKSEEKEASKTNNTGFSEEAAVYEKSKATTKDGVTSKKDHAAIVAQMKADAEQRSQQLISIVQQTMSQQGNKIGQADSIWSFLAKGDFTVSPEVKAQAQADIAEDGYWGVEKTSDRILDFAKALAGDDPAKAEELLGAFKKGFAQATKAWGKELPSISQDTYKAVEEKFQKWMDETKTTETEA